MIRGTQLRMAFGGVEVLKGVDIHLRPGEVHSIIGENGAGKSTVAKILAGVLKPTGGTIEMSGTEVRLASPREAIRMGIALIHQEPLTFPDLSVAENIFVGNQPTSGPLKGVSWHEMNAKAREILESLGVRLDLNAKVGGISVADQQMVELASALSHDARVFLFDETTASLTPKEVAELFAIVRKLRDQGCAIAFVSHHLDEVMEVSNRITVMRDGEKVAERLPEATSIEEIIRLMVGRDLATTQSLGTQRGEPVLEVERLSSTGKFRDVSFTVHAGEVVGLAGLVGAGRTEVAQAIFGCMTLSSGSLRLQGAPFRPKSPGDSMKAGLALVPEDRQHEGLLTAMSISENATIARSRGPWIRRRADHALASEYGDKLKVVRRSVTQAVRELSGGNQQKVVLAKWLMTHPKVLILDEPTRGIDVGAKGEVHKLIRDLAEQGLAILMVSSDLPEVLAISDRILVMRDGRLVAEFASADATQESVMFAATGQGANV